MANFNDNDRNEAAMFLKLFITALRFILGALVSITLTILLWKMIQT